MAKPQKPKPSEVLLGLRSLLPSSAVAHLTDLLTEMLLLFYPPFRADDEAELLEMSVIGAKAYVEDLSGFPRDVLRAGWRDVRRAHKVERWPTIEAIHTACLSVMPATAARSPQASVSGPSSVQAEETEEQKSARHNAWLAKWRAQATPAETIAHGKIMERYARGEKISDILGDVLQGGHAMPLMPGERLSRREAERRRQASLSRTEQAAE